MAPKKRSKKATQASSKKPTRTTLIVKALPPKLAKPLVKRKLDDLTFNDFNTIGKQIQKFFKDSPENFSVQLGTIYKSDDCTGCFCFC